MADLMERTLVRDVVLDEPTVAPEEPKLEPPVKPSREERGVEVPTKQRQVRWFHWMIAVLVMLVGATALVYALNDDGTTAVLDTDGSFQYAETQRLERLAPAVAEFTAIDLDGSFQFVETQRMLRLAPTVAELTDGSFQNAETQRMLRLAPADVETAVLDVDGSFQYAETQRMLRLGNGF
jgi:hypothetical protein